MPPTSSPLRVESS